MKFRSYGRAYPQVIAFVGPVGVGKSTQMRLLAYRLRSKGLRVKTGFLLSGHLFSYLLLIILAKILCKGRRKNASAMRTLLDENPVSFKKLFRLWLVVDTISTCLKFLFSIFIPVKFGKIVLVEDYIPSTITHYWYYCQCLKLPVSSVNFSARLMLRLMSCLSTWIIFQDANTEVLKSRWGVRGSPPEKDDYLRIRREILLLLLQKIQPGRLIYVKTDDSSVREVHKLICKFSELL